MFNDIVALETSSLLIVVVPITSGSIFVSSASVALLKMYNSRVFPAYFSQSIDPFVTDLKLGVNPISEISPPFVVSISLV